MNFALIGAAGYVAPRHLKAIRDTGNCLVAAADPHDAVGILDRYSFETAYFREIERFDRHLWRLRMGPEDRRVHYVSICSPNYLHDAHIRLALRVGVDVICEKPLVINPWNLDPLEDLERETGRRINTVLQLRLHPALSELKNSLRNNSQRLDVVLTYITARGTWYLYSWKGDSERSGGLATNIGIHLFDLLMWLFGHVQIVEVHLSDRNRMAGFIQLERANVRWLLSIDPLDLPFEPKEGEKTTFRSMTVDGREVEFTEGFSDLHTRVYEEVIAGRGFGLVEARPAIELVHRINTSKVIERPAYSHPMIRRVARVARPFHT